MKVASSTVRDTETRSCARRVSPGRGRVVRQPFDTWRKLEATYQFAKQNAPELLTEKFDEAAKQVSELASNPKPLNPSGVKKSDRCSSNNIIAPPITQGTNAEYLTARIARDRPDIKARMEAGEFSPPYEHFLLLGEAGMVQTEGPIRLTWSGHAFADLARDDERWEAAKTAVRQGTGNLGFAAIRHVLQNQEQARLSATAATG